MRMMTDHDLLYIKTIADEHSVSKAAQKLFITQPSLSKCIQRIESELGTKLFKRTSSGLRLTFAGERYYKVASDILKIYNDFEIEISDINNLKRGRVNVGCTNFLATFILPQILPIYAKKYPNIEVVIVEANSMELGEDLATGKIDFAIMHTAPVFEITSESRNIDIYPLFKDPFLLVTSKENPLCVNAEKIGKSEFLHIDIRLFANEPFIMMPRSQRIRQVVSSILEKAGISPNIVLTTKSYETARRLASNGLGVTFIPRQYLKIFSENEYHPALFTIDEKYSPYWVMCITVQKSAYVSKAAKEFISMVNRYFDCPELDLK